jgi:Na+/proline symporter
MATYILIIIAAYLGLILIISLFTGKGESGNDAFFLADRKTPWYIVAIGMLGDSISGVTFVAVPGMVGSLDMTYMQLVAGFFVGYLIVAKKLLPLYYRLNLTSIYTYLQSRFGAKAYKTGAFFFILSRTVGSASKLFLIIIILQALVFDAFGISFYANAAAVVFIIYAYTFRNGMRTIIWTDVLQTICLLSALIIIIYQVAVRLDFSASDIIIYVSESPHSRIFEFSDWSSPQHFLKQFLSGIFIVIVMTGLDQNMMQKNLTCRTLRESQRSMTTYGFGFLPMNFLFLTLGILLLAFAAQEGVALPEKSDEILPLLAANHLGLPVLALFTVGIVAASFSNADSALTSLTTSVCIDILNVEKMEKAQAKRIRKYVHAAMSVAFFMMIIMIERLGQSNILDTIYKAASYTYGPLLGLYAIGMFTKLKPSDRLIPAVCIAAPILNFALEYILLQAFSYKTGYEILLFNGALTAAGLLLISKKNS